MQVSQNICLALESLKPVSLQDMEKVSLMNRFDTKYAFHSKELAEILGEVKDEYQVLEINGRRVFRYESLYFDTPVFAFFADHHNQKPNRVKVRYRRYVDTGSVFFEVKKKSRGLRTDKYRIKQPEISMEINGRESSFLHDHAVHHPDLEKKIWVNYDRITLASASRKERVTIDINLEFDDFKEKAGFPSLVIAEVKQDRYSRLSPFITAMRKRGINQLRVSKYVLSVATLRDDVKKNNFKDKLIKINKIKDGNP